jgi:hypothetical protein
MGMPITPQERAEIRRREPYSFLVYRKDGYTWAESGETGEIQFWGADASAVVQSAVNATSSGLILVKGIDPAGVSFTKKTGVTVLFDYLGEPLGSFLESYKVINVPTSASWTASNAGSGSIVLEPTDFYIRTGTTASSRGMVYAGFFGLNSGNISRAYVDWTKRLELLATIARLNSDPQAVARFQLKQGSSEGQLAGLGIGIQINNYSLYGEAYGSARGTVSLGTLTDDRLARIRIVKEIDRVEFWINGVLQGTLTGNAVPNVQGGAIGYLVASIINGATGGVDTQLFVSNIWIIQEW